MLKYRLNNIQKNIKLNIAYYIFLHDKSRLQIGCSSIQTLSLKIGHHHHTGRTNKSKDRPPRL